MNESRLITATRASRMPIQEDFTTDPINLASECSKKLLNGFDSFLAHRFFSVSRPVNETARHSARVIHCADCRLVYFLPPKQLNHFKDESFPPWKRLPIYAISLTTLLQFALNVHAQQDSSRTETRVNEILSKMTLDEKLDYIGGGYPSSSSNISGVFNIKAIPRLGLPWITMVNGPLGIQTLSGAPS